MKKSLIALAALAAAGAASAQSSVTLFGIVDVNYAHYSVDGGTSAYGTATSSSHVNVLTNSGYNSARLGFRGTEDLGGGLSASFWLEGALSPDDGNAAGLQFRRRSTVSLAGNWGEIRLGRDYVPTFWNLTVFDPFGTNGVGTVVGFKAKTSNSFGANGTATSAAASTPFGAVAGFGAFGANDPNAVRADNLVQYFLPANLGGFYGQASYAFDEQLANDRGQYWGGRIGFAQGPFNVAAAYGETKGGSATTTGAVVTSSSPKVTDWNLGGQWDFGMAKLLAQYDHSKYELVATTGGEAVLKSWMIGGLIPVGPGEIRVSYSTTKLADTGSNDPQANQWAIGYVHNLSKRTALYATYAHLKNKDGGALPVQASLPQATVLTGTVNGTSSGFDLGIRHSF
jgi:predicted porin